jgi:hypothetical protein
MSAHIHRLPPSALIAALEPDAPELLAALKSLDDTLCRGFETYDDRMAARKAMVAGRRDLKLGYGRNPKKNVVHIIETRTRIIEVKLADDD